MANKVKTTSIIVLSILLIGLIAYIIYAKPWKKRVVVEEVVADEKCAMIVDFDIIENGQNCGKNYKEIVTKVGKKICYSLDPVGQKSEHYISITDSKGAFKLSDSDNNHDDKEINPLCPTGNEKMIIPDQNIQYIDADITLDYNFGLCTEKGTAKPYITDIKVTDALPLSKVLPTSSSNPPKDWLSTVKSCEQFGKDYVPVNVLWDGTLKVGIESGDTVDIKANKTNILPLLDKASRKYPSQSAVVVCAKRTENACQL